MSEEIEELQIDRSGWGDGPWNSEPDKINWIDEDTDLDCMIIRAGSIGHLCGYVGVPRGHKLYGVDYNADAIEVHGGLTYANTCAGHICHIPEDGREPDIWWLGFDCGHLGDLSPGMPVEFLGALSSLYSKSQYRDVAYVTRECTKLAKQIKELGS